MALDITVSLNDELETELLAVVLEYNSANPAAQVSPSQYVRQDVKERLRISAEARAEAEKLRLRARYKAATAEDRAAIDAILNKYVEP